jgi:acyl dehydratase
MVKLNEVEIEKVFKYQYGPVDRENLKKYAKISGDYNNIHTNDNYADEMGLKGVIAHGCYSLAMVGECLVDFVGNGEVIQVYGEMRGMVRPGDDWLITLTVKSINEENGIVELDFVQESKTLIKIEKDGKTLKSFEADQRGWVSKKDIAKDLIKKEEVAGGILHYRLRRAIPGHATVKLEK